MRVKTILRAMAIKQWRLVQWKGVWPISICSRSSTARVGIWSSWILLEGQSLWTWLQVRNFSRTSGLPRSCWIFTLMLEWRSWARLVS